MLSLLLVPLGADGGPVPPLSVSNALVNGDFEVGTPVTVDTSVWPLGFVVKQVGSVLPGETENRSLIAAAGWTARVFSGERIPYSTVRWGATLGTPLEPVHENLPDPLEEYGYTAGLEITYDERDRDHETLVLTQALGQRPHAGLVTGIDEVRLEARTAFGHPIQVRAGVYTVEDRWNLTYTPTDTVTTATYQQVRLQFPGSTGTVTEFFLFIEGSAGSSEDTVLYLDDIELRGGVLAPAYDGSGGIIEPWLLEVCDLTGVCL